jgi:uncharacterized membrane protein YeaQ/YmgE (transglycosylase-associated protein family)
MLGFIMTLIVAAIAGYIGDALTKYKMPGGFIEAMIAGLVGSWIGAYIPFFRKLGPVIAGIPIIPTILGAAIFIFVLELFRKGAEEATKQQQ